ncbi:MAG TPA: phosphatidylglycerophosphatase A [Kofleriaceae bacterium]|nr:phosphatidylglycerophosphatase A [Kofleriaceae bacterium]
MNALAKIVATALGAGYAPRAPGTCGTAVAVPLAWALASLPMWQFGLFTAALTLLGVACAARADRAWGTEDNQRIVIDEVAGYLVTVLPVDRSRWAPLAVGFVIFRALDIVKPPPIRWLDEHLPGGWGVVMDDVAAGVMGAGAMLLLDRAGALAYLGGLWDP